MVLGELLSKQAVSCSHGLYHWMSKGLACQAHESTNIYTASVSHTPSSLSPKCNSLVA